jgi:Ran GTPase-activating protein (RanGAP) involved in mRNA processing and transport
MVLQLDLSDNQLSGKDRWGRGTHTAEGITAIADALRVNGGLTELNIAGNSIKDEGITAICNAVLGNKESKLAKLNVAGNNISPVGATAVAAMVAVTGALTKMRYVSPQT